MLIRTTPVTQINHTFASDWNTILLTTTINVIGEKNLDSIDNAIKNHIELIIDNAEKDDFAKAINRFIT